MSATGMFIGPVVNIYSSLASIPGRTEDGPSWYRLFVHAPHIPQKLGNMDNIVCSVKQ